MSRYPGEIILTESAAAKLGDFAAGVARKGGLDEVVEDTATTARTACMEWQQMRLGNAVCGLEVAFEDRDQGAFLCATCKHCQRTGTAGRAVAEAANRVEQATASDRLTHERIGIWKDFVYLVDRPSHPLHGYHIIGVESLLQLPSGKTLKQPHSLMNNLAYLQYKNEVCDERGIRQPGGPYPGVVIGDRWLQEKTLSRSFRFLVVEWLGEMLTDKQYLSGNQRLRSRLDLLQEAHEELLRRGYLQVQ